MVGTRRNNAPPAAPQKKRKLFQKGVKVVKKRVDKEATQARLDKLKKLVIVANDLIGDRKTKRQIHPYHIMIAELIAEHGKK